MTHSVRADVTSGLPADSDVGAVGVGCGLRDRRVVTRGAEGRAYWPVVWTDPADGMLQQARKGLDVDWILGDLSGVAWDRQFDLVLMTGHAFQVFLGDNGLRVALATMRSALTHRGRLAFETRNPLVRAWETWTPDNVVEIVDDAGAVVRMAHEVTQSKARSFRLLRPTPVPVGTDQN